MRHPNESRPAVWIGRIKPELTLLNQPKTPKLPPTSTRVTRKKSPYPMRGVSVSGRGLLLRMTWSENRFPLFGVMRSKSPYRPPGRGAEPVNQGFGTVQRREPALNIAEPGEVFLTRLRSQGLLGVFQLLM